MPGSGSSLAARVLLAMIAIAGPMLRDKYGLRAVLKLAFAAGDALNDAYRSNLAKTDSIKVSTLLSGLLREDINVLLYASPENNGELFDRVGWLLEDEPQSTEGARERRR